MNLADRLGKHLLERRRVRLDGSRSHLCGVLLPLLGNDSNYELLYTLRSNHLPTHKGDVSFPGGKQAATDADLRQTALRETFEEVGIAPKKVRILGALDDIFTMGTRFRITPWIGVVEEHTPITPEPYEVADTFTLPVDSLWQDARAGGRKQQATIDAAPHEIWGTTLQITENFLQCLCAL